LAIVIVVAGESASDHAVVQVEDLVNKRGSGIQQDCRQFVCSRRLRVDSRFDPLEGEGKKDAKE
jgi:hypothetical protein